MSHQPERIEKDCLNCGTIVQGRYCHHCGQENIPTHQNFWSLSKHFVFDIFHFDGKFFDTLKGLVTRPGKVPLDYVKGKRASYLDPIRMYLFTSALFFLVFFNIKLLSRDDEEAGRLLSSAERSQGIALQKEQLAKDPSDSIAYKRLNILLDTSKMITVKPDSPFINDRHHILLPSGSYEMDSHDIGGFHIESKSGWLSKKLNSRYAERRKKSGGDTKRMISDFFKDFAHKVPYLLFVSLPIFALLLKLLYVRRKQFIYSDHAVFTLYHYIFSFLLMLLFFAWSQLEEKTGWDIFGVLATITLIGWPLYLWLGMRRFYGQSRGKTTVKFIAVNFLGFFTLLLLFAIFIVLSFIF